jgi:hypothetical protein
MEVHTQSLSFLALGTPISSKVLGPLLGAWPLGLDGWEGFEEATDGGPEATDGAPDATDGGAEGGWGVEEADPLDG